MSIYADKYKGAPTGQWRVDLQRTTQEGVEKYRKRWASLEDARADEGRVKALWASGEAATAITAIVKPPTVHSISSVMETAEGDLWHGLPDARNAWMHIKAIRDLYGPDASLDLITTLTISDLRKELSKGGRSPSTVNRYLSHFRTFLEWAKDSQQMSKTAFAEIKWHWKKESKGRIRWIEPEEEEAIRRYLVSKKQERIWDLIKVAIETGCRRGELLSLKKRQILNNRLHLWKTKTDEARTIPLTPETTARIMRLLERGMPTARSLRSWWDRAKAHIGLAHDEDFVFHTCRHTCATRLLDADVDILVIKEWLGHSLLSTTQRYTHVRPKNLDAALIRRGEVERLAA